MRTSLRLILAVALVGSAACGSDVTRVVGTKLPGTWSQDLDVPGSTRVMTLSVQDTTVTGTGTWALEAGGSGNLSVFGLIRDQHVTLVIAQDNDAILQFTGEVPQANVLTGTLANGADMETATFRRIQVDPH